MTQRLAHLITSAAIALSACSHAPKGTNFIAKDCMYEGMIKEHARLSMNIPRIGELHLLSNNIEYEIDFYAFLRGSYAKTNSLLPQPTGEIIYHTETIFYLYQDSKLLYWGSRHAFAQSEVLRRLGVTDDFLAATKDM